MRGRQVSGLTELKLSNQKFCMYSTDWTEKKYTLSVYPKHVLRVDVGAISAVVSPLTVTDLIQAFFT